MMSTKENSIDRGEGVLQGPEEKMELSHEPVPGYRGIFFAAITVGVLYLSLILFMTVR